MCAGCHADADYMASYNIPEDQYEKYVKSVHGKLLLEKGDLSAPACNSCHGNHGATPPGLASIAAACGECHASNRDLFNNSPHKEPWDELEIPECIRCHSNHLVVEPTDKLIGVGEKSLCIECHSKGDDGFQAASMMGSAIDSLKLLIDNADSIIKRAEKAGINVEDARFNLDQASSGLIKARNLIHTFEPTKVTSVTSESMVEIRNAMNYARNALKDINIRQLGLLLTSIIIILLAGLLFLKIRQIERKKSD
jgi:predicted CXXCH cytochrome family protein